MFSQITYRQTTRENVFKLTTANNEAMVKNLSPGDDYIFEVVTIKGQHSSMPEQITATTSKYLMLFGNHQTSRSVVR